MTDKRILASLSAGEFDELVMQQGERMRRKTHFDRYLDLMIHLQKNVVPQMAEGRSRLDATVVGLGLQTVNGRKFTFEQFHAANLLEGVRQSRRGFDWGVTVIDNDPLIVEIARRQNNIIVERKGSPAELEYIDGFLPGARREPIEGHENTSLVLVPEGVRKRIRPVKDDVVSAKVPKSDLIFYIAASLYVAESEHKNVARKLAGALNEGGVLVTNDLELNCRARDYGLVKETPPELKKPSILRKKSQ